MPKVRAGADSQVRSYNGNGNGRHATAPADSAVAQLAELAAARERCAFCDGMPSPDNRMVTVHDRGCPLRVNGAAHRDLPERTDLDVPPWLRSRLGWFERGG